MKFQLELLTFRNIVCCAISLRWTKSHKAKFQPIYSVRFYQGFSDADQLRSSEVLVLLWPVGPNARRCRQDRCRYSFLAASLPETMVLLSYLVAHNAISCYNYP